ncbi:hypothetical protein [Listeria booriae]|uniref:Uncharacterized protein n=1 Tax=Listeria booriae TaxID=1552123 RepID=A0A7X0XQN9_9LIST|nr:hypothetical protein [Listeria booriae]MBC1778938.1 hypothetical protein [Listeria booriae]
MTEQWIQRIQKYGTTVGASVSILALFFTMFISGDTLRDQLSKELGASASHTRFSGIEVVFGNANTDGVTLGLALFLLPILLLVASYWEPMKKYRAFLQLAVPVGELVMLFIVRSQMKSVLEFSVNYGANEYYLKSGIGFWLILLVNLGLVVMWVINKYQLSLNRKTISTFIETKNIDDLKK